MNIVGLNSAIENFLLVASRNKANSQISLPICRNDPIRLRPSRFPLFRTSERESLIVEFAGGSFIGPKTGSSFCDLDFCPFRRIFYPGHFRTEIIGTCL